MQGSSNGSERGHTDYKPRVKGSADEEESIQLHDMAGANTSNVERVKEHDMRKNVL